MSLARFERQSGKLDPPAATRARWLPRFRWNDTWAGLLLVFPPFLLIIGLIGYPLVSAVYTSLTDLYLIKGVDSAEFVGLANFQRFLTDPKTPNYIRNTALYVVGALITQFSFGLLMATLLNRPLRFLGVLRAVALIPWVMPSLVATLVWRWILDGQWGILNHVLMTTGLTQTPVSWLANTDVVWFAVIQVSLWRSYPFWYVNLLAGLQVIPPELYEVAKIDGASAFRSFIHITLPMLRPVIVVLFLLETIWRTNEFTLIWALTKGGPGDATMTLAPFVYMQSFSFYRMGYATSVSVVMTLFMLVFTLIYLNRTHLDIS